MKAYLAIRPYTNSLIYLIQENIIYKKPQKLTQKLWDNYGPYHTWNKFGQNCFDSAKQSGICEILLKQIMAKFIPCMVLTVITPHHPKGRVRP